MKNHQDFQSLFFLLLFPGLIVSMWLFGFSWWLYGLLLFVAIVLQIIHHNHVHLGIWRGKTFNRPTCHYISVLTGVPSAMLVNGHIKNHHVHHHGPKDETRTYRFGGDHNHALGYLLHPFQALAVLIPMFWRQFLQYWPVRHQFAKDILLQSILIATTWSVLLLMDWRNAIILVLIPQAFGVHWLLGANYLQHAHCDGESEVNYARNFTGWINWIWFNIGFHTAHHDHPKAHWSTLRTLHEHSQTITDPRLEQSNLLAYIVKTWCLGPWLPAYRSHSLRVVGDGNHPASEHSVSKKI